MFHNGEYLFVRYDVAEDCTAARVAEDNGEVVHRLLRGIFHIDRRQGVLQF